MRLFLFISLFSTLFCEESDSLQRVKNLLFLNDYKEALSESKEFVNKFPKSEELKKAYIIASAFSGEEKEPLLKLPTVKLDDGLLEDLCWGFLNKGINSELYWVKLTSLIGSYLTQDVRAVSHILKMMKSSNIFLRSIAVRLAPDYGDEILKREISELLHKEKVWQVKLEAIRSAGLMRLRSERPFLEKIASSGRSSYEEKAFAIEALVNMYDELTLEEVEQLSSSNKAELREVASEAVLYFDLKEAKWILISLTQDPVGRVKLNALKALVLLNVCSERELLEIIKPLVNDSFAPLSIIASWAYLRVFGDETYLMRWLNDASIENRLFASGALAASGFKGEGLLIKALTFSDKYVRVNAALGLLGLRKEVKKSADVIYQFLSEENNKIMWEEASFRYLAPSKVLFAEQIPNYPEAVDQMARIELFSHLAIVEDSRAMLALRDFLKKRGWNIGGAAAAILLKEGDESTFDLLRSLIKDPDKEVALQAALVLALFGRDQTVIPFLESQYIGADREMKERLLEGLSYIASRDSIPFFLKAMEEPFQSLRVIAASGLIKSLNN